MNQAGGDVASRQAGRTATVHEIPKHVSIDLGDRPRRAYMELLSISDVVMDCLLPRSWDERVWIDLEPGLPGRDGSEEKLDEA